MTKEPKGQKRYPIHSKTKGSLGENEDWWELAVDTETGQRTVVHSWHHMNPYKGITTSEGQKELSLAEFAEDKHGKGLADELAVALKEADKKA